MDQKISLESAREQLWNQGVLTWKLRSHQRKLYDSYVNCKDKVIVWNCSRRLGKSNTLCILALETCLKTPYSIVKYCCAKQKDARNIIREIIRPLIEDCPPEIKPEYKTQEGYYLFPNGSIIQITGLDNNGADRIRGGSSHLAIIDEAALVKDLDYIVKNVLIPTTLTTKGKIILASTPPRSPGHSFIVDYLNTARIKGNLVTMTVYDNPYIDQDELHMIISEYKDGVNDPDFRREYMSEIIIDDNYAVIPEFAKVKDVIVKEWPRAKFFDFYVAMDIGVKDLTVVLFAWFDFVNSKIIIEDEYAVNGQRYNTNTLAEEIKKKEKELFTDKITGEEKIPYMRVSDTTLTVLNDLWYAHALRFVPTRKDDADAALNKVRSMMQNEQIIINPRCKVLIDHLANGVWNKNKTSYERSAGFGHYDAIDALKYLVRNVQTAKNPYPTGYLERSSPDQFIMEKKQTESHQAWNSLFKASKPTEQEKSKQITTLLNTRPRRW